MKFAIKTLFLAVVLLIYPLSSSAQLADITQIPGQVDRSEALASASIIESANGDLLAFILENGELTNVSGFPWEGEPAMLWTSRSTDGGDSWSTPQIIRVGIDTYGSQGIKSILPAVLPSGRIVLTFYYQLAAFPNFAKTTEVYHSDDHGATWIKIADKDTDSYAMTAMADGNLVSVDIVGNDINGYTLATRSSADDGATWTAPVEVMSINAACGQDISQDPDSGELVLLISSCGAEATTTRRISADGSATWSAPENILASNSLFGVSASLVHMGGGSQWLIYRENGAVVYRISSDGGASWSDATVWTAGVNTNNGWDLSPACSASSRGPICAFWARPNGPNFLAYVGLPGISKDPRFPATAIEESVDGGVPVGFALSQNYPNPFNPSTQISFELASAGDVRLEVFNVLGSRVAVLVDGLRPAGLQQITFDASNLPSGTYLYRLSTAAGVVEARMMALVK